MGAKLQTQSSQSHAPGERQQRTWCLGWVRQAMYPWGPQQRPEVRDRNKEMYKIQQQRIWEKGKCSILTNLKGWGAEGGEAAEKTMVENIPSPIKNSKLRTKKP